MNTVPCISLINPVSLITEQEKSLIFHVLTFSKHQLPWGLPSYNTMQKRQMQSAQEHLIQPVNVQQIITMIRTQIPVMQLGHENVFTPKT